MTLMCKDCKHGDFQLTPTGRIKKGVCGFCRKAPEIKEFYAQETFPPCVTKPRIHTIAIWPDYDASACKFFERKS